MKIAIDIDETILGFLEGFFDFYREHHNPGFSYNKDEIHDYVIEDILGIDSEKTRQLFTEYKDTLFFKNMSVAEGAKEAILNLSKKHNIVFITARPLSLNAETKFHIKSLFPKNNFQIIHSYDNNNQKIKEKADFCHDMGIGTIIEDDVRVASKCAEKGVTCFLIDKPWNKNHKEHKKIVRVKNWSEVLEKI